MSSPTLTVSADALLLSAETPSQRTLEWAVRVPKPSSSAHRPPLNLALVLDRSGSMAGDKLRHARDAACHVVDRLEPRDHVAVVAYDHEVTALWPSQPAAEATRRAVKDRIRALEARGSTDLGAGWLQGAAQAAESQAPDRLSRVLLLTDGLANQGMTDVGELAHHAAELRKRGISTSTFGVGLDFNEELLEALALQGGGHFHFIEHSREAPGIFARELGELLEAVAREASLRLSVPPKTKLDLLGDLPHEQEPGHLRVFLGDLCGGEERYLYTQLLTAPGVPGEDLCLIGELTYTDLDNRFQSTQAEVRLTYRPASEADLAERDMALLRRSATVRLSTASSQAVSLERRGSRREASRLLRESLAATAPVADPDETAEYQALSNRMEAGLSEVDRKRLRFESYTRRTSRQKE